MVGLAGRTDLAVMGAASERIVEGWSPEKFAQNLLQAADAARALGARKMTMVDRISAPASRPMKVAFLSPSLSRTAGGIFEIERGLAQALHGCPETEVEAFGLRDECTSLDAPLWGTVDVRAFDGVGPRNFGYSRDLRRAFLGRMRTSRICMRSGPMRRLSSMLGTVGIAGPTSPPSTACSIRGR